MKVNNDITIIAFLDVLGYRSLIECTKSVIRKVENTAKLWKKGIKHKSDRKKFS